MCLSVGRACASPVCWDTGWDPRAWIRVGAGAAMEQRCLRLLQGHPSWEKAAECKTLLPKHLECALVIIAQVFSAFSLQAFMDWPGLPKKYSPKPDYKEALNCVQTFRFGLAIRNQS